MTHRRRILVLSLIGALAVVVAEGASLAAYSRIDPGNVVGQTIHDAFPPVIYIASGVIAVAARPDSRIGLWLWLAGILTFTGNFGNTQVPGLSQASIGLMDIYQVPIGLIILTYPTGRLDTRPVRWLAGIAIAQIVVMGLLVTAYLDPARCVPGTCPANPFLFITDQGVADAIFLVRQATGAALWLALAAFVLVRYLRATPALRHVLTPVWIAGVVLAGSGVASSVIGPLAGNEAGAWYDYWIGWAASVTPAIVFLIGLLRQQLDRAAITGFVEELAAGVSTGRLREAFARLVGDPHLTLAFPIGDGVYVDTAGATVQLAGGDGRRAVTPIEREGREVAVVVHDAAVSADPGLLRAAGAAAGLALENERLTAEVRARLQSVRSSRTRLVEAADAERVRIERMLHDGAQQRLVALAIRLRSLSAATQDPVIVGRLDALGMELDEALRELRELARGIHPAVLVQAGLHAALSSLAQRSPVRVVLDVPNERFPPAVESAAYYVAAEALTNAARHAQAQVVTITASAANGALRLCILDDGVGGADPRRGSGLAGLEDRVAAVAGVLAVGPGPDGGTIVEALLPITSPSEPRVLP